MLNRFKVNTFIKSIIEHNVYTFLFDFQKLINIRNLKIIYYTLK